MKIKTITTVTFLVALVVLTIVGIYAIANQKGDKGKNKTITSFEECVEAGYPVMESYPEQCSVPGGETFTRDIGNEMDKHDLIRVSSPRPGEEVGSNFTIEGQARGYWFFEATFPVSVENEDGEILAETYATAGGDWMTEDFVSFTAEIEVEGNYSGEARLVLHRANASGLPENDDQMFIPIEVASSSESAGKDSTCYVGGCSGQICSDDPNVVTSCEWRPEYACYDSAICERQADGECGWTETEEFDQCIAEIDENS
ncbi:MAG: Gmad2 immunoglobulin-like domain-containing protein [Candidatus Campbellbacteria bacterium]|nr:Gmad2 immunoglobulin-like domain-containing protein [Candidatus Campbellbacteria bacterium]